MTAPVKPSVFYAAAAVGLAGWLLLSTSNLNVTVARLDERIAALVAKFDDREAGIESLQARVGALEGRGR